MIYCISDHGGEQGLNPTEDLRRKPNIDDRPWQLKIPDLKIQFTFKAGNFGPATQDLVEKRLEETKWSRGRTV